MTKLSSSGVDDAKGVASFVVMAGVLTGRWFLGGEHTRFGPLTVFMDMLVTSEATRKEVVVDAQYWFSSAISR